MKRVLIIDSKRAWSQLLLGHECVSIISDEDRISKVKRDDLLIIHTTDGVKNDREALNDLAKPNRPTLLLVTGGLSKNVGDWQQVATEYGTTILEKVSYFAAATDLRDEERARYTAHLHQLLNQPESPPTASCSDSLLEQMERAVATSERIRSLVSALRFWIDAKLSSLPIADASLSANNTSRQAIEVLMTEPGGLKILLLPGFKGVRWDDFFADRISVTHELGRWLKTGDAAINSLEAILGSRVSLLAAKTWAAAQTAPALRGGAIRLLYELARSQGNLIQLGADLGSAATLEMANWSLGMWASLLRASLDEAEIVTLQSSQALARAEFTCSSLLPNDDERSVLHHNALRQEVLQRLIAHDVPGQLSSRFEENIEPDRLAKLAKLLSECEPIPTANVQSALNAWRGNKSAGVDGVKQRLLVVNKTWRSPDWLNRAGLAVKASESVCLDRIEAAIAFMDSIIGTDLKWQQHCSLAAGERKRRAEQFWIAASKVLDSLNHWRAAPTRLFEFYDET